MRRFITVLGLAIILSVAARSGDVGAWSVKDAEDLAVDALRLAPRELREAVGQHLSDLRDGASLPARSIRDCEDHGFSRSAPRGSAVAKALDSYHAAVEAAKYNPPDPVTTARRLGTLGFYASAVVQPTRMAWSCSVARRGGAEEIYLARDSDRLPNDIRAELIQAGAWIEEIEPKPALDPLLYATAASLVARIWAAAWTAAGHQVTWDIAAGHPVKRDTGIHLRALSLVETWTDIYERANDNYLSALALYPRYIGLQLLNEIKAQRDLAARQRAEAIEFERAGRTKSATAMWLEAERIRKTQRRGLEVLERSVIYKDGLLIVNGRFLNHGPTPASSFAIAVQLLGQTGKVIRQVVSEQETVSADPEGFLPGQVNRFRAILSADKIPSYASARVVLLLSARPSPKMQTGPFRTF